MVATDVKKIALVGNPNSGKTSLFNALTGLRQKVANYPGVTVDVKQGIARHNGDSFRIIDLPGTYSIYPKTEDERIVNDVLLNKDHPDHPDGIIVVADGSNLKRNLLFCSQIIDMGIPVVIALTMQDILEKEGVKLDLDILSEKMGVPVVAINPRKLTGIDQLREKLGQEFGKRDELIYRNLPLDQEFLSESRKLFPHATDYQILLYATAANQKNGTYAPSKEKLQALNEKYGLNFASMQGKETLDRYRIIDDIIKTSIDESRRKPRKTTDRLDKILTNRFLGPIILMAVLFVIFQFVFALAEYPMQWVEAGTAFTSDFFRSTLPPGWGTDLLIEGIVAGLGGIIVFIPQIAILFGFLTILEDTGYMARISYITDRVMKTIGLSGKSVIPMMSGLACAIPAIMATRSIENWRNRLVTILVTPFMTCSARLPVYALLISVGIPNIKYFGIVNLQGLVLLAMYLLGIGMSMLVAYVFKFIIKSRQNSIYVMELPTYRAPRWRNVLVTMYERSKIFVVEAGKVIMVISVILWALASYGPADIGMGDVSATAATEQSTPGEAAGKELKASFAGQLGRAIEPVIEPIGFDWKMGIAVITSFAAREVFVSTMATIYSVDADEENFQTVRQAMLSDLDASGEKLYSVATVLSLLVFYAFAMQCMSTLAVVKRETKTWKWPVVQFVYMTAIAYVASFVTFQLFSL
jgi:ferrous iron transport protein B